MKTTLAALLILSLSITGCASASGGRGGSGPSPMPSQAPGVWAEYARNIPTGSRVRIGFADGRTLKGTLMRADDTTVLINPATRVPEAPVEVPLSRVRSLELDRSSGGVAKAVVIGALAGVGATFGVLFLVFAFAAD